MDSGSDGGRGTRSRRDFLAGLARATGASMVMGFGLSRQALGSTDSNCGHFISGVYAPDATCGDFCIESDNGCGRWNGSGFDPDGRCSHTKTVTPPTTWPDDGCGNADTQTGLFLPDANCGMSQGLFMDQFHTPDHNGGSVDVQTINGEPVQVTDPDGSCAQHVVPGVDWVDQDNDCAKPACEPNPGLHSDESCHMERQMGGTYDDGDCRRPKPGGGEWPDGP